MISVVTGVHLHDYGCTLKAYHRDVIKHTNLYGEMHRFIPALGSWGGAKVAEIKVRHHPRKFGKSKYGISRTIRVLLDLFTVKFLLSYATRPIHLFGSIGLLSVLIGFITAIYLIIGRLFFDFQLSNRPLFLIAIFFIFAGIQFITMGLLGEIMIRTYHEAQKKPIYTVKETLNLDNEAE